MLRWLLLVVLFVPTFPQCKLLDVKVSAKSAILINADNGKILFAKNIDDPRPPGSTTKIATCLFSLQKIHDMDAEVKAPLECLIKVPHKIKQERLYQDPPYRLEPDGTSYGVYTGELLSFRNLLYGLMLPSGNDAANVLAYHLSGGDIPGYMNDLNQYLKSIGCHDTQFYNPHGLHYPNHLTTARDLARLGQEAIKYPEMLEIMQTVRHDRPKTNKQPASAVWTRNHLLRKGKFYYPKAFGIKSGYHAAAGHVFVGAAKDEHRTLISVVLNSPTNEEKFRDTINLFEAAFAEKRLARHLLNQQESVFTTKVKGSKKLLQAGLQEDLMIHYFPSEEEELIPKLVWDSLELPIEKGQRVGMLYVNTDEGVTVKMMPICALEGVERSFVQKVFRWILCWKRLVWIVVAVALVLVLRVIYRQVILHRHTVSS